MSKVVLIPGAFNPPTKAHMEIGKRMREQFPDADIIYVPCSDSYLKEHKGVTNIKYDRFQLLRALFSHTDYDVTSIESSGYVNGKMWQTIHYYKPIYNNIYLALGTDNIKDIHTWENYEYIKDNAEIIEISRNEIDDNNISSTKVRKAYYNWNWGYIRDVCPDFIYRWMIMNQLEDVFGEKEKKECLMQRK